MAARAGADGKGGRNGRVDVDAHELGRALILRAGPHGLAHLGLADEGGQRQHDDDAGGDGQQRDVGNGELAVEKLHSACDYGRIGLGGGLPDQQSGVLEEIADADGGDQHRQRGGGAQRRIGQPLDHDAEDGAGDHCQQGGHDGREI